MACFPNPLRRANDSRATPAACLAVTSAASTPVASMAALLVVVSLALGGAVACAPFETHPPMAPALGSSLPMSLAPAADMEFTRTLIVDFAAGPVGYVVEVLALPEGLADQRPWPVGTWLVQDIDFKLVGFISPSGTAYTFDDDDVAHLSAFGNRNMSVAGILGQQGTPQLREA